MNNKEISQENNKEKKYSHSERKQISYKIKKLKKKEDYVKLFKIIKEDTSNKFTQNSNGIWLDFKCLSNQTVKRVEIFLNIALSKDKTNSDSVNSLEYVPYSKDELAYVKNQPGPKLSNYEKSILRRHRYDEKTLEISSSEDNQQKS
ncbi:hypothetical protein CPAV1605_891 [seawater metagenome]|uniref:NET domain-containing protein n=1 Tax=seawater metagenome TaxID=1561972 RepID=A0A5E8CJ40_9ZZZZ